MRRSAGGVEIRSAQDVLAARQWIRNLTAQLGFDPFDQIQIATGVSELGRELVHAGGGELEVSIPSSQPHRLVFVASLLAGSQRRLASTSDGMALARRLLGPGPSEGERGEVVTFGRLLPRTVDRLSVSGFVAGRSIDSGEELQNRETDLVRVLEQIEARETELAIVRQELEETNRGVLALYAELDEKAEAVRRAAEERSRFLSNVTHELRTPLSSIVALSRLILTGDRPALTDGQVTQINLIQRSAQELLDFVSDLLDLAKAGAGKITVRSTGFDLEQVFAALRGVFRPLTVDSPVLLVIEAADVPAMEGDENKVSQILRNLVSNALKFTESGEIRVSARHDAGRDEVVVTVRDTGTGIARENLGPIFDEFVQVDSRQEGRERSSGLGLPLSRRLAELMGGSLTVESELGAGSSFTLRLPRVYATTQRAVAATSDDYVLVVDDDPVSRYVAKEQLERNGWRVVEAADVDMALRLVAEGGCRAVVTDIAMPGMSGYELIERLMREPATSKIPIVVRTSLPLDEVRDVLDPAATVLSKDDPIESLGRRIGK